MGCVVKTHFTFCRNEDVCIAIQVVNVTFLISPFSRAMNASSHLHKDVSLVTACWLEL